MARIRTEENPEETRLISPRHPHEEEEEEGEGEEEGEALSLCDMTENTWAKEVDEIASRGEESHEVSTKPEQEDSDFRFDSGVGSELKEMSSADELFSKGRILPVRHSVSLGAGSTRDPTRRVNSFTGGGKRKNIFMNHSQPSPQPQIRRSSSLTGRVSTSRNAKSSIWDFLRLGLVRAPEIELRYLKLRTTSANAKSSVSRNSSCSSTSTSCNSKNTTGESKTRKQRNGFVLSEWGGGSLFGDCKCSVSVSEAVALNNGGAAEKERRKKKRAEKTEMSRKRTFEWIKDLSHASLLDH